MSLGEVATSTPARPVRRQAAVQERFSAGIMEQGTNQMAKSKAELQVVGMTGQGVVSSVEELLAGLAGVEYVHVNLGASKVHINYDDSVTGNHHMNTRYLS